MQASIKLTHAATLELTLAQNLSRDADKISGSLGPSLAARSWTDAARTASALATDLQSQQAPVGDPEALLDPLWSKWVDAMLTVVTSAQQLSLTSAANQITGILTLVLGAIAGPSPTRPSPPPRATRRSGRQRRSSRSWTP